jgi:hypothetical protein
MRKDLDPIDLRRALVGFVNVATSPDWQQNARRGARLCDGRTKNALFGQVQSPVLGDEFLRQTIEVWTNRGFRDAAGPQPHHEVHTLF